MKPFNLEEYLKNPSRKIVTRDGRNATIHCTNCRGNFPIIAEIEGMDFSIEFTNEGKYNYVEKSDYDLFFAPEKHEGWMNLYKGVKNYYPGKIIYPTEEEALKGKGLDYITTIKIEWEDRDESYRRHM